jgi:plasmid maintenance system antidote protein VapI
LRLARYFNTSAGSWLNLQSAYDLEVAQGKLSRTIEREVRPASFANADAALLSAGHISRFRCSPRAKIIGF